MPRFALSLLTLLFVGCGGASAPAVSPEALRQTEMVVHGLQLWVAVPEALEEAEPAFRHTPAAAANARATSVTR